jgi:CheY-like chemotaxis protein
MRSGIREQSFDCGARLSGVPSGMNAPAKPTLLIVDDDERIRYLVGAAAERCGEFSAVEAAADGQAAFDAIKAAYHDGGHQLPDIILSDLSMPRMDGLELIRELKRNPQTSGIPIAMMTSSNRPHDREDALAAGCCAFFEKPARMDEMLRVVASLPEFCPRQHI